MILIPFALIFILLASFLLYKNYKLPIKRSLLLRRNVDQLHKIKEIIEEHKLYTTLSHQDDQLKLCKLILIFIHEKNWSQHFDENQKIIEALKACRALVNKNTNFYPHIKKIESSQNFEYWLSLQEKQLSIELGKSYAHQLGDGFSYFSKLYFLEPTKLQQEKPQVFQTLKSFYH